MRPIIGDANHALKIAAALRLLLLDERPLLVQASVPYRRIKTRFKIRPSSPDADSQVWFANDLLDPDALTSAETLGDAELGMQVGGVQVWNRALGPEEVKRRYEQGRRRLAVEQTIGYQVLLRQTLVKYETVVVTVKDAVRFLCHVAGGVHHGMPKNAHEEKIDEVCRTYQIQELPSVHASIFAVARIVVRGLEPLEAQIRQEPPGPRDLR